MTTPNSHTLPQASSHAPGRAAPSLLRPQVAAQAGASDLNGRARTRRSPRSCIMGDRPLRPVCRQDSAFDALLEGSQ